MKANRVLILDLDRTLKYRKNVSSLILSFMKEQHQKGIKYAVYIMTRRGIYSDYHIYFASEDFMFEIIKKFIKLQESHNFIFAKISTQDDVRWALFNMLRQASSSNKELIIKHFLELFANIYSSETVGKKLVDQKAIFADSVMVDFLKKTEIGFGFENILIYEKFLKRFPDYDWKLCGDLKFTPKDANTITPESNKSQLNELLLYKQCQFLQLFMEIQKEHPGLAVDVIDDEPKVLEALSNFDPAYMGKMPEIDLFWCIRDENNSEDKDKLSHFKKINPTADKDTKDEDADEEEELVSFSSSPSYKRETSSFSGTTTRMMNFRAPTPAPALQRSFQMKSSVVNTSTPASPSGFSTSNTSAFSAFRIVKPSPQPLPSIINNKENITPTSPKRGS